MPIIHIPWRTRTNFVSLNWVRSYPPLPSWLLFVRFPSLVGCLGCFAPFHCLMFPPLCVHAGELVWRRHGSSSLPSHHALRATCIQLLPLVEMYCKWELQEDCSDLRALMLRFDSEAALESHELGRSMLQMLRDDDVGVPVLPPRAQLSTPIDPFYDIKSSIAAVNTTFQAFQPQVHVGFDCHFSGSLLGVVVLLLCEALCGWPQRPAENLNKCPYIALQFVRIVRSRCVLCFRL
jgi:hypothetical protein